ncbi:hypothetical protein [Streptomyces sp. NPDC050428]|uniref:hypothetical protein n=1 Tax=Streptomyces sp. NPDC050428 TaxID=3155757 RepID=UPI003440EA45
MPQNGPQDQTGTFLLLLTVAVLLLVFFGLAYLTHRHPSLGTPLIVAMGGVTLMVLVFNFAGAGR